MVGYFGSKGASLIVRCYINQPVNGVRPFAALSASSPILAGTALGAITQVESTGASSYNALWLTANQRLARGLQFNASYTFSKSLDYNSLSSQGVVVQINIIGDVDRWFDPSVFKAVARFGGLGRNVVIGPRFDNVDFSIIKNTKIGEWARAQFRAEFFDLFNHANLGQPGAIVDTPAFGRITATRFPTGDSGSSRQVQFALKLMF